MPEGQCDGGVSFRFQAFGAVLCGLVDHGSLAPCHVPDLTSLQPLEVIDGGSVPVIREMSLRWVTWAEVTGAGLLGVDGVALGRLYAA